jgi:hypothetical protein
MTIVFGHLETRLHFVICRDINDNSLTTTWNECIRESGVNLPEVVVLLLSTRYIKVIKS